MTITFTRRNILELAVLGGGAAACADLVPMPRARRRRGPESQVLTVCGVCNAGCGIRVRRAGDDLVQLTGSSGHPINDGGVCARAIAEIQNLYHPNRLRSPMLRAKAERAASGTRAEADSRSEAQASWSGGRFAPVRWEAALSRLTAEIEGHPLVIGVGRVPIAERTLIDAIAGRLGATVVEVRPPSGGLPSRGLEAFGAKEATFDLSRAGCVLSLGWDWLQSHPSPVEAQRAFASIRRRDPRGRVITVSSRLSTTAAKSDLWVAVPEGGPPLLGLAVAHVLVERGGAKIRGRHPGFAEIAADARFSPGRVAEALGVTERTIAEIALDLESHPSAVVVAANGDLAGELVAVGLDVLIGAVERPGGLVPSPRFPSLDPGPAPARADRFPRTERPPVVLTCAANPVYLAPASSGWKEGLASARFVAAAGEFADETAEAADLLLAASTPLESPHLVWGATQGGSPFVTSGPAASPTLHDTRSMVDILFAIARGLGVELPWSDRAGYFDAVARSLGAEEILAAGGFMKPEATAGAIRIGDVSARASDLLKETRLPPRDPELPLALEIFGTSAFPGGAGSHLPYLHGLSHAGGREAWRTTVELHPRAAEALGVQDGDPVEVESSEGRVEAFARLREGIHPASAAIAIGLGRRGLGPWADGQGSNPIALVGEGSPTRVRVVRRRT